MSLVRGCQVVSHQNFRTSGDTFDFKQSMDSQAQRHWLILNDAEFKLFSHHHVLQVPRVKEPSGGHILNWKIHESLQDANLSHDLPHRGSLCSSWITSSIIRPVNSPTRLCQVSCFKVTFRTSRKRISSGSSHSTSRVMRLVHLRLSSFVDQLELFRAYTPLLGSSGGPITVHIISCSLL